MVHDIWFTVSVVVDNTGISGILCHCYEIMEGSQGKKAVKWHRLPFTEFLKYEISRPMFRPFLYGAGYGDLYLFHAVHYRD